MLPGGFEPVTPRSIVQRGTTEPTTAAAEPDSNLCYLCNNLDYAAINFFHNHFPPPSSPRICIKICPHSDVFASYLLPGVYRKQITQFTIRNNQKTERMSFSMLSTPKMLSFFSGSGGTPGPDLPSPFGRKFLFHFHSHPPPPPPTLDNPSGKSLDYYGIQG